MLKQKKNIWVSNKKGGWRAANDESFNRDLQERNAKRDIWSDKLSRCKNAHAKRVVENAFAAQTPTIWKGKLYVERPAVVEKKVAFKSLILLDAANISAQRSSGNLGQSVIGKGKKVKTENVPFCSPYY